MSVSYFPGAATWALMAGLAMGTGAVAQAQQEESPADGRVVQIGQADKESAHLQGRDNRGLNQPTHGAIVQQELPKYWIGLRGGLIGDDDALRAHVDLPAHQGLIVVDVVPDSPAAKAGLQKHDILLRANEIELHEMPNLIDLVGSEGEKKGQISLDIVRHGERQTVTITPEERPADALLSQGGEGGFGGGGRLPEGFPQGLMGQLQGREGMPFDFRNFGPGVIIGRGQGVANMPNGVSVSVQKQDGQAPRVTVQRGDEKWEVVGDDPESIKQLPEDLRPFVEQMLHGGSPLGMQFDNFQMPNLEGLQGRGGIGDDQIRDRLEQMERQMNQLLERLNHDHGQAEKPQAEQEETK